jgi:hypothetical protein
MAAGLSSSLNQPASAASRMLQWARRSPPHYPSHHDKHLRTAMLVDESRTRALGSLARLSPLPGRHNCHGVSATKFDQRDLTALVHTSLAPWQMWLDSLFPVVMQST